MAGGSNSFMESREGRMIMYGVVCIICAFYTVEAVRELLHPGLYEAFREQIGDLWYTVFTVARGLATGWASVAFGRMAYKAYAEKKQ
jgi:hypothetical protein